jgi:hypothetical protein
MKAKTAHLLGVPLRSSPNLGPRENWTAAFTSGVSHIALPLDASLGFSG